MPTIDRTKNAIKVKNIAQSFSNLRVRQSYTVRFTKGKLFYLVENDYPIPAQDFEKKFPVELIHINEGKQLDYRQIL